MVVQVLQLQPIKIAPPRTKVGTGTEMAELVIRLWEDDWVCSNCGHQVFTHLSDLCTISNCFCDDYENSGRLDMDILW